MGLTHARGAKSSATAVSPLKAWICAPAKFHLVRQPHRAQGFDEKCGDCGHGTDGNALSATAEVRLECEQALGCGSRLVHAPEFHEHCR